MTIRPAKKQNLKQLANLAQKVYAQTFGPEMSEKNLSLALEQRSEKYFKSIFDRDIILLAVEKDKLLAFIQFGPVDYPEIKAKPEDLKLDKIYVDSNYHGQGIGKKLMAAMLSHPKVKPKTDIYLDVYAKNNKATALYEKYAFKIIGKVPFKVKGKILGYDLLMKRNCKKMPK